MCVPPKFLKFMVIKIELESPLRGTIYWCLGHWLEDDANRSQKVGSAQLFQELSKASKTSQHLPALPKPPFIQSTDSSVTEQFGAVL